MAGTDPTRPRGTVSQRVAEAGQLVGRPPDRGTQSIGIHRARPEPAGCGAQIIGNGDRGGAVRTQLIGAQMQVGGHTVDDPAPPALAAANQRNWSAGGRDHAGQPLRRGLREIRSGGLDHHPDQLLGTGWP